METKIDLTQQEKNLIEKASKAYTFIEWQEAEANLKTLTDKHPNQLAITYHYAMNLNDGFFSLHTQVIQTPEIVEYILYDNSLAVDKKNEVFKLIVEQYLEWIEIYNQKITIGRTRAAIFCLEALSNPEKDLVNKVYYHAAFFYERNKNYREALRCCLKIKDHLPAAHLLVEILVAQKVEMRKEQKYLFCLHLLKEGTEIPEYQKTIHSLFSSLHRTNKLANNSNLRTEILNLLDKHGWIINKAERRLIIWINQEKIKLIGPTIMHFFRKAGLPKLPLEIESIIACSILNVS